METKQSAMTRIKVAVRVRPLTQSELEKHSVSVIDVENRNTIAITNLKVPEQNAGDSRQRTRRFTFDYAFQEDTTQEEIFQAIGKVVGESIKRRFHTCVLAYGQSSSGKTHTMMGDQQSPGLTPRLCQEVFQHLQEAAVGDEVNHIKASVSYLEIYNEKVRDLLAPKEETRKNCILKVREHPKKGPYVQGLTEHQVTTSKSLLAYLRLGNHRRSVASTQTNEKSSRSHAVFVVRHQETKVHLVDLAGSERGSYKCSLSRSREGANINKSLVALGNVISALAERTSRSKTSRRRAFVPYRDSVLTWLLKDALGGSSQTVLIANVSPSNSCYSETVNTLRFGQRAKLIVSSPVVIEDPKDKIIRELRTEIIRLKEILKSNQLGHYLENKPMFSNSSHTTSEDSSTEKEVSSIKNDTSSNISEFSFSTSPIPEIDETLDPAEKLQEDVTLSNNVSETTPNVNSKVLKKHDFINKTEEIVPVIAVSSSVKSEKLKNTPKLRRTISEYTPFKMERKNSAVFGSQETVSSSSKANKIGTNLRRTSLEKSISSLKSTPTGSQETISLGAKVKKIAPNVRRPSIDKPISFKPLNKPDTTSIKKVEKSVSTENRGLDKVTSKVGSIRRAPAIKPRSQIVAAVTHRLYAKTKVKEASTDTSDAPKTEEEAPKELSICSNARMRLKELTQRALKAHKSRHQETQTDLFPVLRVKERSTDVNDLKIVVEELKEASTSVELPDTAEIGISCFNLESFENDKCQDMRNAFIVTRSCGVQVEEVVQEEGPRALNAQANYGHSHPMSFTKYLNPNCLELPSSNPIYTNSVNINISHNYNNNNGSQRNDSVSEDSIENIIQSNVTFVTPDLLNNHNSLESHKVETEPSENKEEIVLKRTKFATSSTVTDQFSLPKEFISEVLPQKSANLINISINFHKITSIYIPDVYVSEICVLPDEERCLPLSSFCPCEARPRIIQSKDVICYESVMLYEPVILKSIMKQVAAQETKNDLDKTTSKDNEEQKLIDTFSQTDNQESDSSSEDYTKSENEIPDSLDYHMANAKKVHFAKVKKPKRNTNKIMSNFFEEATTLMNNLKEATNKLESYHPIEDFDLEVTVNGVTNLENLQRRPRRRPRKRHPPAANIQSDPTLRNEFSQTCSHSSRDNFSQYDYTLPVNKYDILLEDSCRRLEEKLNNPRQTNRNPSPAFGRHEDYLEENTTYNPWDLREQNEDSSLESNPVYSDYGSLPRRSWRRPGMPSMSPSAFLRQLTSVRQQVIESSKEDLYNGADVS